MFRRTREADSISGASGFLTARRSRSPRAQPKSMASHSLPIGKSFVTSVGQSQSTLWIHDLKGERQITFEGYAYLPSFSADTKRLYYLQRSSANRRFVSGELWTIDLETGKKQRLLPDLMMENYNVSPDGKQVVFISASSTGRALWIGTTDGSAPSRLLANQDCSRALFAPNGEIYFVGGENADTHLQKINADGRSSNRYPRKGVISLRYFDGWTMAGGVVRR